MHVPTVPRKNMLNLKDKVLTTFSVITKVNYNEELPIQISIILADPGYWYIAYMIFGSTISMYEFFTIVQGAENANTVTYCFTTGISSEIFTVRKQFSHCRKNRKVHLHKVCQLLHATSWCNQEMQEGQDAWGCINATRYTGHNGQGTTWDAYNIVVHGLQFWSPRILTSVHLRVSKGWLKCWVPAWLQHGSPRLSFWSQDLAYPSLVFCVCLKSKWLNARYISHCFLCLVLFLTSK